MIPQNELRTGNLVWQDEKILPKLQQPNGSCVMRHVVTAYSIMHNDTFIPVPITDEWLIRIGFKEYDALFRDDQAYPVWHDSSKSFIITGFDLDTDAPYYNLVVTNDDMTNSHCIGTEISYIHQLQNLYFALTGKELELKQNA